MTYSTLPTRPGVPSYEYRIMLGATWYILRWRWLSRIERWSLDVLSDDGTALVTGRIVECVVDLMRGLDAGGQLIAAREREPHDAPDIGWTAVTLYWVTP